MRFKAQKTLKITDYTHFSHFYIQKLTIHMKKELYLHCQTYFINPTDY